MLDSKNLVTLSGNLVADLEVFKNTVVRGTLAVSFAGTENNKSTTGFFDFVYFLDESNRNSAFVSSQMQAGNMSKGSPITLVGRIVQERFETKDGQKASKIKLHAESIDYYGFASSKKDSSSSSSDDLEVANMPDGW